MCALSVANNIILQVCKDFWLMKYKLIRHILLLLDVFNIVDYLLEEATNFCRVKKKVSGIVFFMVNQTVFNYQTTDT